VPVIVISRDDLIRSKRAFLAEAAHRRDGEGVPRFVEEEFHAFPARGFLTADSHGSDASDARPSAWSRSRARADHWKLSLADGQISRLTKLQGRRGSLGTEFATDERYLYFTLRDHEGHI